MHPYRTIPSNGTLQDLRSHSGLRICRGIRASYFFNTPYNSMAFKDLSVIEPIKHQPLGQKLLVESRQTYP